MAKLYIIGTGLYPDYISLRGLNVLKRVSKIFVETYTSHISLEVLKDVVTRYVGNIEFEILTRKDIEDDNCRKIIECLDKGQDVALLVPGDPMIATTHGYIRVLVRRRGHDVELIHGVSIVSAVVSLLGLSPYRFGPVCTVTYPRLGVYSHRPYDVTKQNLERDLHTLLLLDIKDEGGYMTIQEAVEILRELENIRKEGVFSDDRIVLAVARAGYPDWKVAIFRIRDSDKYDLGPPPHSIVIPARLAEYEAEVLIHDLGLDSSLVRELLLR